MTHRFRTLLGRSRWIRAAAWSSGACAALDVFACEPEWGLTKELGGAHRSLRRDDSTAGSARIDRVRV